MDFWKTVQITKADITEKEAVKSGKKIFRMEKIR